MSKNLSAPDNLDQREKTPAIEIFGKRGEQILLLTSAFGTWEKIIQYQSYDDTLPVTQKLIDEGYLECSEDGQKLWITEKAFQELSF